MSFTTETETLPKTPQHAFSFPSAESGRKEGGASFRLSPFAKRTHLDPLPGTPEGRQFGFVSGGIQMPAEGACYIVEFLEGSQVRVLGYVDKFGRAFRASEELRMPPAYAPALALSVYEDRDDRTGCVTVRTDDGAEHRIGEFRQTGRRYALESMLVRMGEKTTSLTYDELFARLYLAACVFPEELGIPLVPFGPTEVFEALASEDVFSAIARIVETERTVEESPLQAPAGTVAYLIRLLQSYGLDQLDPHELPRRVPGREQDPLLPGAVDVRLARTRAYANAFYLGFDQDAVTPEGRSKLLCLESVLNRFWLLTEELSKRGTVASATEQECERTDREIVDGIGMQAPFFCAETTPRLPESSEWDARLRFAQTCEQFKLPYRLSYRMRVNLDAATMGIEVTCPIDAHLPQEQWSAEGGVWIEQPDEARYANEAAYAANTARLVLAAAFDAESSLETVSIDVVRDIPARERVLSGVVSRKACFAALEGTEERDASYAGFGPVDPAVFCERCGLASSAGVLGRLDEIPSARELECEELCPPQRYVSPETDERPVNVHRGALHGIVRIEDLAINEGADRAKLAAEVADAYESRGRDGALSLLKDMHDRTEDLTVRASCTKAELAISEGALGEDPRRALEDLFADAWGLRALRARATAQAEEDPASARQTLEEIVLLAEADGSFADTDRERWRYFDSYASRALFAWEDDDPRPVRPLPDELFAAHHGIANLLHGSFEEHEVALEHARKCTELAPSAAAGYLTLARAYFLAGDYPSEIETIRTMLQWTWNPSDVGLGMYWLAFALWKTGDAATGAACYLQAIKHDQTMRDIATRELDELLRENPRLRLASVMESADMVEAAGFPLSCTERNARRLIETARIAADNGNLSLAGNLLAAGLRTVRDDAFYPVLESLTQSL